MTAISNTNWFITNKDIQKDLNVESVSTEIGNGSKSYLNKLYAHQNEEIRKLTQDDQSNLYRRLHRLRPSDLAFQ